MLFPLGIFFNKGNSKMGCWYCCIWETCYKWFSVIIRLNSNKPDSFLHCTFFATQGTSSNSRFFLFLKILYHKFQTWWVTWFKQVHNLLGRVKEKTFCIIFFSIAFFFFLYQLCWLSLYLFLLTHHVIFNHVM